jgi:NADPH:quinone reductase-like Zn-dependent oxidoreductase
MRAVVHRKYGPPERLHLEEVEKPTPGSGEVLIRVHATTVNRTDTGFRMAKPWIIRFWSGILRPRRGILGSEFAGVVEAVGAGVTEFAAGDAVFGVNADRFGAHAEYLCMSADAPLARKPDGMTFEQAAAVCDGAILALTCLRPARLEQERRILVYGASGSIGTAAVQLAKVQGAHVTAVCSTRSLVTVRSLGADEVIDYTKDDFTRNGEIYDVIFDAVGKHSFRRCRRSLARDGTYVETDLGFLCQNPILALLSPLSPGRKVKFPLPKYSKQEVLHLKDLIEAGQYRAVIDRRYPLEQAVEATRYVETGQKTGNVVLTVIP